MDPLQTRAIDALQPFLALAKSASSPRAAVELISQATAANNTFVFAELLESPNIQALRQASESYSSSLSLLEIYSWGTWQDYIATPGLPPLSEIQSKKLRMLSLLPLATSRRPLSYSYLQTALSLDTSRELEDLVISANYAGLFTARLSPATGLVHVMAVAPLRDLRPQSVQALTSTLDEWDDRCTSVLADLEGQVRDIRSRADDRRRRDEEFRLNMERALQRDGGGDKGAGKRAAADRDGAGIFEGLDDGGEHMDLDGGGGPMTRNAAYGKSGSHRKNPRTRTAGGGGRRG